MTYQRINIEYILSEPPSAEFLTELIRYCLSENCRTQSESSGDECWYFGELTDYDLRKIGVAQAIAEFAVDENSFIKLWYNDLDFLIRRGEVESYPDKYKISISIDPVHFRVSENDDVDTRENVKSLIDLVKMIYSYVDPSVVYGGELNSAPDHHSRHDCRDGSSGSKKPDLYWLNISDYSNFGSIMAGIQETPIWLHEELNGDLLLILTPNPLMSREIEGIREDIGESEREND